MNSDRIFNKDGFDSDGFSKSGYDNEGFDRDGFSRSGYDRNGYDRNGFNRAGYNKEGYDKDGYDRKGFDTDGYDREGYDTFGYDKSGYGRDGFDASNFDREGYDRNGYDAGGFDREGYNKDGYDCNGDSKYDANGFDKDGYDKNGYDRTGYDKNGRDKHGRDRCGLDEDGCDAKGIKKEGFINIRYLKNIFYANFAELYFKHGDIIWNLKTSSNITDALKRRALNMVCQDKYTEQDLIHICASLDDKIGWAVTKESFCYKSILGQDVILYCDIEKMTFGEDVLYIVCKNREAYILPTLNTKDEIFSKKTLFRVGRYLSRIGDISRGTTFKV